jgi:hypothetical protein
LLGGGAVLELEASGALEAVLAAVDDAGEGTLSGDVVGDGFFVELQGGGTSIFVIMVIVARGGDAVGLAFEAVEAILDEGDMVRGVAVVGGFQSACVVVAEGGGDAASLYRSASHEMPRMSKHKRETPAYQDDLPHWIRWFLILR